MISVNLTTGKIALTGSMDIMLTEYTALTTILLSQLKSLTDLETAFDITTLIGNLAAEDMDKELGEQNINAVQMKISEALEQLAV